MGTNAISDPDMKAQIEAEGKKFEFTTQTLRSTAELVQATSNSTDDGARLRLLTCTGNHCTFQLIPVLLS